MILIVGLGNPGEKYDNTRHNIGFETLDSLLKKYSPLDKSKWEESKKTKSLIKKIEICDIPVLLAKPQTFMNNSGMAVSALLSYYKLDASEMIVVHDELDLPIGKIQVRFGGGTAGHNGLESILEHTKTEKFIRIRMGISKPKMKNENGAIKSHDATRSYVVSHFTESEHKDVRNMKKHVQKQLEPLIEHGLDVFMSKFNVKG